MNLETGPVVLFLSAVALTVFVMGGAMDDGPKHTSFLKGDVPPNIIEEWAQVEGHVTYPDWLNSRTAEDCMPPVHALAAGQIDVAVVPLTTIEQIRRQNTDVNIVAGVRFPSDYFQLYVRAESDIDSVDDLAGKRIAMSPGVIGRLSAMDALAGRGLNRSEYDIHPTGNISSTLPLLDNGTVAAAVTIQQDDPAYRSLLAPIAELEERRDMRIIASWIVAADSHRAEAMRIGELLNASYKAAERNEEDAVAYGIRETGIDNPLMFSGFARSRVHPATPQMLAGHQSWLDDLYRDGYLTQRIRLSGD